MDMCKRMFEWLVQAVDDRLIDLFVLQCESGDNMKNRGGRRSITVKKLAKCLKFKWERESNGVMGCKCYHFPKGDRNRWIFGMKDEQKLQDSKGMSISRVAFPSFTLLSFSHHNYSKSNWFHK